MPNRFWLVCWSSGLFLMLVSCEASSGGHISPSTTSTGAPTSSHVSILTDRSGYRPTDRIQATVRNTLSTPVHALDGQAECSILGLEVQVDGKWQSSSVASCLSAASPTRQITIDPGGVYTVSIHAGSPGVSDVPMPSGDYRLVLSYWTDSTGTSTASHPTTTIYSQTFSVR